MRRFTSIVIGAVCICLAGCAFSAGENKADPMAAADRQAVMDAAEQAAYSSGAQNEYYMRLLNGIYKEMPDETFGIERTERVLQRLAEEGVTAVDKDNRLDMVCAADLEHFIACQKKKEDADTTVICLYDNGDFSFYALKSTGGTVTIKQYFNTLEGECISLYSSAEYEAITFTLTDDGYLMIEGEWNSLEQADLTGSEEKEYIALRIKPLDDKLRELNERYIRPISYRDHNLFICNWQKGDYSAIDFSDAFAVFYKDVYGSECPYQRSRDMSKCVQYLIPCDEVEKILQSHLAVSSTEIKKKFPYDKASGCYIYRPRILEESDYAEVPYPEVTDYRENADGSLTLTVHAVFPNDLTSALFSHEVTVKEENGQILYVSNQIALDSELDLWWHSNRLGEEDLKARFAEINTIESELQILNRSLGRPQLLGYPVKTNDFYSNIENADSFDAFLKGLTSGVPGEATLFELREDGSVGANRYDFDGLNLWVHAANFAPHGGDFVKTSDAYQQIATWRYTRDGWFCYVIATPSYPEVTEVIDGSVLIRVLPISDENREASLKYVWNLGYQGNNVLCADWDADSIDTVDFIGVYESLYRMEYGKNFEPKERENSIPADDLETLVLRYFHIDPESLRKSMPMDDAKENYKWNWIGNMERSFFGLAVPEVVKITDNADGTRTLTVNAVSAMMLNNEAYITSELTVKDMPGGDFKYISNKVISGADRLPYYQYRTKCY